MEELNKILEGYSNAEKRSSLYYLGRYVKQVAVFENYEKDIFEDEELSAPTETIKVLTYEMISIIEEIAKKSAADFTGEEFDYWMDVIAEIEDAIDPQPTDQQITNAVNQINNFNSPNPKESEL